MTQNEFHHTELLQKSCRLLPQPCSFLVSQEFPEALFLCWKVIARPEKTATEKWDLGALGGVTWASGAKAAGKSWVLQKPEGISHLAPEAIKVNKNTLHNAMTKVKGRENKQQAEGRGSLDVNPLYPFSLIRMGLWESLAQKKALTTSYSFTCIHWDWHWLCSFSQPEQLLWESALGKGKRKES